MAAVQVSLLLLPQVKPRREAFNDQKCALVLVRPHPQAAAQEIA